MGLMDRFLDDSQMEDKNVAPEESVDAAFSKLESFFDEPKTEETKTENQDDDVKFIKEETSKKPIWADDLEIISETPPVKTSTTPEKNVTGQSIKPEIIEDGNDSEFSETHEEKLVKTVNWDDDVQVVVKKDSQPQVSKNSAQNNNVLSTSGWKITNPNAYKPPKPTLERSETPPLETTMKNKPPTNKEEDFHVRKQHTSPKNILAKPKKARTPLDTSVMKSRLKLIAAEKRSPAYIQYLRQVQNGFGNQNKKFNRFCFYSSILLKPFFITI